MFAVVGKKEGRDILANRALPSLVVLNVCVIAFPSSSLNSTYELRFLPHFKNRPSCLFIRWGLTWLILGFLLGVPNAQARNMESMTMSKRTNVPAESGTGGETVQRWQQQKAAMTREAILQASVKILVEKGYTGLTTVQITNAAEVSRGALHHHFANRSELMRSLIDHILHRRLQTFLSEYVSKLERSDPSAFIGVAAKAHWESLLTDEYTAFLELTMAARTDKEVADLLIPATLNFDQQWMIEMHRALPQWEGKSEAIELANDFASALHVGLLINRPFMGQQVRRQAVRNKLVEVIMAIYKGTE